MNEKLYEVPEETVKEIEKTSSEKEVGGGIPTEEEPYPKKVLPKWLYDFLCFMARFFLPACGAAYGALAAIWGFPYGEAVISTVSVIIIFLSTVLVLDSKKYFKEDNNG